MPTSSTSMRWPATTRAPSHPGSSTSKSSSGSGPRPPPATTVASSSRSRSSPGWSAASSSASAWPRCSMRAPCTASRRLVMLVSTTELVGVRPARRYSTTSALLLSLAVAAEIFSGNWQYFGVPAALDRVLLVLGLVALLWGGVRSVTERTLRLHPTHALLLTLAVYATFSALIAHTFSDKDARFALLDRFGLVPFLLFVLAPLVFGRRR